MAGRRLSDAERALWQRVTSGVRPLEPGRPATPTAPAKARARDVAAPVAPSPRIAPAPVATRAVPGLDGGWDRRIGKGRIEPDRTIDLHGHSLASAHAMLDRGLAEAIHLGERVILLVTGRAPRGEGMRPHVRGSIRASVEDWIAVSPHAARIAAIRPAHPRHGGAGALYVILRRARTTG
ncbi:Smr/MutS family protein [Stakelama saccharophila]|uniref:Smr/MutS family protein n=1 Tax=Stakelama saccharophila TaxID=3075605 RepID=A0ABZ0BCP2_9SPHN|nr:Smr/MutS family protein [Stakelama sp. W311]WNO55077.1 Smr/MutS family protein [Stakelama sp. W311]